MAFHQLLYTSTASFRAHTDARRDLDDIIRLSIKWNTFANLTGALLLAGGTFIQVIEGPIEPLEMCFERICCDIRHRDIRLIKLVPASRRAFGQWSMLELQRPPSLGALAPLLNSSDQTVPSAIRLEDVIDALQEIAAAMSAGSPTTDHRRDSGPNADYSI